MLFVQKLRNKPSPAWLEPL